MTLQLPHPHHRHTIGRRKQSVVKNGAKAWVILGFHDAMHARDGDIPATTVSHGIEQNFPRPPLIDHADPHTKHVDGRHDHLDLTSEFFLQFGVGNLDHGWAAVGTAVGQVAGQQIAN